LFKIQKIKLLDIVNKLKLCTFHIEKSIAKAEDQIQNLLLTTFRVCQSQDYLSQSEIHTTQKYLLESFDQFKYSIDVLVMRFDQEKYISYLAYRSGLEFLTQDWVSICQQSPVENTEYTNKCQELKDIITEFDEILEDHNLATGNPFGSQQDPEDISNIPNSHIWWKSFR